MGFVAVDKQSNIYYLGSEHSLDCHHHGNYTFRKVLVTPNDKYAVFLCGERQNNIEIYVSEVGKWQPLHKLHTSKKLQFDEDSNEDRATIHHDSEGSTHLVVTNLRQKMTTSVNLQHLLLCIESPFMKTSSWVFWFRKRRHFYLSIVRSFQSCLNRPFHVSSPYRVIFAHTDVRELLRCLLFATANFISESTWKKKMLSLVLNSLYFRIITLLYSLDSHGLDGEQMW